MRGQRRGIDAVRARRIGNVMVPNQPKLNLRDDAGDAGVWIGGKLEAENSFSGEHLFVCWLISK